MKRTSKIAVAVGAALTLGLGAAVVSAHSHGWGGGPGYGMGHGMHGGMGPGYGMGRGMSGAYPGTVEDRLEALKSELSITATQEPAWQAFVDNAKQQVESRQAWFNKMHEAGAAASAPERLEQQTEMMKQRQAHLESSATALKNLYAALTPEQKAIADQRFGGFGPGHRAQGHRSGPGERSR